MKTRVAIVGATGYTGAELVRLLSGHAQVEIVELVGASKAGKPVAQVLPALVGIVPGTIASFDADRIAKTAQVAFSCLPHGASAGIVKELRSRGVIVLDLSADFRLRDVVEHEKWYGKHHAPELVPGSVYGLCELHREVIRKADLVAVPGCFPTASILAIAPILRAGLAEAGPIVIDAKSGVSGAGREVTERTHFSETAESIRAYKIAGAHRHTAEIEETLSGLGAGVIRVTFTPHLVPMTRGILSTAYLRVKPGVDAQRITDEARRLYDGSPSVHVLEPGICPDTLWVRGSNRAHVSYTLDARTGLVLAQGAIDNLVKGASGQAVQCMNLRLGFPEGEGLGAPAVWP